MVKGTQHRVPGSRGKGIYYWTKDSDEAKEYMAWVRSHPRRMVQCRKEASQAANMLIGAMQKIPKKDLTKKRTYSLIRSTFGLRGTFAGGPKPSKKKAAGEGKGVTKPKTARAKKSERTTKASSTSPNKKIIADLKKEVEQMQVEVKQRAANGQFLAGAPQKPKLSEASKRKMDNYTKVKRVGSASVKNAKTVAAKPRKGGVAKKPRQKNVLLDA